MKVENNENIYYNLIFKNINIINIIEKYTNFVTDNNVYLKDFKLEKLLNLQTTDKMYKFIDLIIKNNINLIIEILINSTSVSNYKDNVKNKFLKEINTYILSIDNINSIEYQRNCQHMIIDMISFIVNEILEISNELGNLIN